MTAEMLEEKVAVADNNDLGIEDLAGTPLDEFILALRNSDDLKELKEITYNVLSSNIAKSRINKNNDAQLTIIFQCIMMDFQNHQKFKSYLKANKSSLVKRGNLDTAAVILASIMILIQHAEFNYMQKQASLIKNQFQKVLTGIVKASNVSKHKLKDASEEKLLQDLTGAVLEVLRIPEPIVDTAKQILSDHLLSYKKNLI